MHSITRRELSRLGACCILTIAGCMIGSRAFAQASQTITQDSRDAAYSEPKSARPHDTGSAARPGHGRLRPFYDFSYHSAPAAKAANPAEYLVDQRFWGRRATLVVVTPVTANVLQPDEGYAETTTEMLIRQIAADLGVREAHDQVSQTIDILKRIRRRPKNDGDGETERPKNETSNAEKPAPDKVSQPTSNPEKPDARGLQTLQLVVLADTRPLYSSMSLYDRAAVVERSLNEYLKRVPVKRERVLGYLDADQFHFGAFPGKEACTDMMANLGVTRPEFHVLVVDRKGEVVGSWSKATLDPKQVSAAYIRASKE